MNYGHFFALDLEASDITNGISVFNYHEVENKVRGREFLDTPQYPIYLQFTSEGVSFYIHYILYDENGESPITHQNSLILSLPVSADQDSKDNLTDSLNRIYETIFPIDDFEGKQIGGIIEESTLLSSQKHKGLYYSSLGIFHLKMNEFSSEEPYNHCFVRNLFLDFLYDLEHTDVFENAFCYADIYDKLRKNFLFDAIINKAEYYYLRQQQLLYQQDACWNTMDKNLFYAEYYAKAEQRWIETIINPKADRIFYESRWFSDGETEMDFVYISGDVIKNDDGRNIQRIAKLTRCCNEYFAGISSSSDVASGHLKRNIKEKIEKQIRCSARMASDWYIRKYCFSGTFKIWYGHRYRWSTFVIIMLVLGLCASLALPSFNEEILPDQVVPSLGIIAGILFIWLLGFTNYRKWYIRNVGCINVLMPRLFASIVAAWFTLSIGEDLFKGFFDIVHQKLLSGGLVAILTVFVYYEIGKLNPYITVTKQVCRVIVLILVAFSYAFIVGILVINFFGGKYLERSDYIDEFYVNNVYPMNPLFVIPDERQPRVVHDIFYETLLKYDDKLVTSIAKTWYGLLGKNLVGDSLKQSYKTGYAENYPIVGRNGNIIGKVNYNITLLLIRKFVQNENLLSLERIHEKMMEGSTVKSRVVRVADFYHSLQTGNTFDNNYDISPIDSSFYTSAWMELLKSIDNHQVYQEVLKELRPTDKMRHNILIETRVGILIFRDMLLQFTFFAMFIGIFIQLIVEEKPITEPV